MPDYTFFIAGFGVSIWIALGVSILDFGAIVEDDFLTPRDVIAAFTLEPLLIGVGFMIFGLIFCWPRLYIVMQRSLKHAIAL